MYGIDEDNVKFINEKAYYCGEPLTGTVNFWHKKQEGAYEIKCRRQTSYRDGLKNGSEEDFTLDGQTIIIRNYKDNKLHGETLKYSYGRVTESVEYIEGEKQENTLTHYDGMGRAIIN